VPWVREVSPSGASVDSLTHGTTPPRLESPTGSTPTSPGDPGRPEKPTRTSFRPTTRQ
jgi:hypothetical protein